MLKFQYNSFCLADRDIRALRVKCDNEENGCEWNGVLRQLDSHVADCGFALIDCPNNCLDDELKEVSMMRKELESHLCGCPNREFECPHCKERGKYHEITGDHLDDCPQLEIPCPKRCKTEVIRSQIREHLSHACPNVAVACKYSNLGCKESRLRKNLEEHENDSTLHLQLALDAVAMMEDNCVRILPSVFKMTDFESCKRGSKSWYSPPFYTHSGGYKMLLKVYADGIRSGKGTHVSVSVHLMPGRNDDNLVWPFRGEVTVELLNQLEDSDHYERPIRYSTNEFNKCNEKVVDTKKVQSGLGVVFFFPHCLWDTML